MPSETSVVSSGFRWLQRKRYQYEVTFSLYMLTPTEKFIFSMSTHSPGSIEPRYPRRAPKPGRSALLDQGPLSKPPTAPSQDKCSSSSANYSLDSCIFIIFSMVLIAGCLYLPQHITFLMNRAWFYYQGDGDSKDALSSSVSEAVATTVGDRLRAIVETARASAATAAQAQKEL